MKNNDFFASNFQGRTNQGDFWGVLISLAVALGLLYVFVDQIEQSPKWAKILTSACATFLTLPVCAMIVRRVRDTGHSGWFALVGLLCPVFLLPVLLAPSELDEATAEEAAEDGSGADPVV